MLKSILFDADDTLVDYKADATRAFHAALSAVGRDMPEVFRVCIEFDYGNWDKAGLSDVHLPHIQTNFHDLYRGHVTAIFRHAEEAAGLGGRAAEAEEIFLREFSREGKPIAGAMEAVAAAKKKYRVYAATNGLSSLQRPRLAAFGLDGIFVSEELGAIKPSPAFFLRILETLGAAPAECLMVGDSLASDIAGAQAVGIPCVYYDPQGRPAPDGVRAIRSLALLADMV